MSTASMRLTDSPVADPSISLPRLLQWLPIAVSVALIGSLALNLTLFVAIAVVALTGMALTIDRRRSVYMLIFLLPLYRTGMGSDVGSGFGVFDLYSVWFIFLFVWRIGLLDFFRFEKHRVFVLGVIMLFGLVPSIIHTEVQMWYWRGLLQILINLLIMSALYFRLVELDDETLLVRLLRVLSVVTAAFALQGIYMSVRYRTLLGLGGVAGRTYNFLFGDPNYYSGFLLMVLCFSAALVMLEHRRGWKRLAIINSAILFVAIVLTVSRAGYLATLIIGVFFTMYLWKYADVKRLIGSVLAIAVVISGVVLLTTNLGENLVNLISMSDRVTSAVQGKDASVNQRKNIAIVGWRMAWHRPVTGVGFGNFEIAFDRFREAELSTKNGEACHNTYLKLLAEAGLVGFLAAMIFYAALVLTLWKSYRAQTDPQRRALMFGLLTGVLSYFLMSATLDQVYEANFWTMSAFALATTHILARRAADRSTTTAAALP